MQKSSYEIKQAISYLSALIFLLAANYRKAVLDNDSDTMEILDQEMKTLLACRNVLRWANGYGNSPLEGGLVRDTETADHETTDSA